MINKFKTKGGLCTPYALLCGYIDTYTAIIGNIRCTMELDGVYHVKLYGDKCNNVIDGTQHVGATGNYWYWQRYDTLSKAREGYALATREVKRAWKL